MTELQYKAVRLVDAKADARAGTLSGYGAIFGNEDASGDVIQPGAFTQTLGEWKQRGKWPPMLLQHGGGVFGGGARDMLPVGQWTDMAEDRRGLKVEGALFAIDTETGRYIHEGLKAGVLDGLSIGFQTRESITGTRAGEPDRVLTNIDLWEVSIVTFPANPKARVTTVKGVAPSKRELERLLREAGFSRRVSQTVISALANDGEFDTASDKAFAELQAANRRLLNLIEAYEHGGGDR